MDEVNWNPDRRPVAVIRCYNGTYQDDERGLNKHWQNDDTAGEWLLSEADLLYKKGFRRFMISNPAGHPKNWGEGKPMHSWPTTQWSELSSEKKKAVKNLLSWADDNKASVFVYGGMRFDGWVTPDLDNSGDLQHLADDYGQWLKAGVCFDNASKEDLRDNVPALLELWGKNGTFICGEAIPFLYPEYLTKCPWFALHRYIKSRAPDYNADTLTTELGVGLHRDEFVEATDKQAFVDEYVQRGFVPYVYWRGWDDYVLK